MTANQSSFQQRLELHLLCALWYNGGIASIPLKQDNVFTSHYTLSTSTTTVSCTGLGLATVRCQSSAVNLTQNPFVHVLGENCHVLSRSFVGSVSVLHGAVLCFPPVAPERPFTTKPVEALDVWTQYGPVQSSFPIDVACALRPSPTPSNINQCRR